MTNTPHTIFRLDEETKAKLINISEWRGITMTDAIRIMINKEYDTLYINIDERYGPQVAVTINDYKELKPVGMFIDNGFEIIEEQKNGREDTVAVKPHTLR